MLNDALTPVAMLAALFFLLALFWALGANEGRCQATCAASGLALADYDGAACWCEGQEQPVKALGGDRG